MMLLSSSSLSLSPPPPLLMTAMTMTMASKHPIRYAPKVLAERPFSK
jgi:hypothetical protein